MKTEKLFYKDPYMRAFSAEAVSCSTAGGGLYAAELDRTAFYPEGGGQPADHGCLRAGDGTEAYVSDVQEQPDGRILHYIDRPVAAGSRVTGTLDWERRYDHMQQHSGEHIVSGMICSAFGCDNVGFHMGERTVTIDYNAVITSEQLKEIEEKANAYIREDHEFVELWPDEDELGSMEFRSKKELHGEVRITSFPGADCCACCGVHVRRSAEAGPCKFISCIKFSKGTRIELICGKRAVDFLSMNYEQNSIIAKSMAASLDRTAEVYLKQKEELIQEKLRFGALESRYLELVAAGYRDAGDVLVFEDGLAPDPLRKLCVLIGDICGGMCLAFSAPPGSSGDLKYACIHNGADIAPFIRDLNRVLCGRGGGRNGFAQGSVKASEDEIRRFWESRGHQPV